MVYPKGYRTRILSRILDAATAGEPDKPSRNTVDGYREHLQRLFILDPVEAWTPAFVHLKRLANSSKHHLVDPALAARLVGVGASGLLIDEGRTVSPATVTWLGAPFESLAVQSVLVYAEAMGARVGHLRTKNGDHETSASEASAIFACRAPNPAPSVPGFTAGGEGGPVAAVGKHGE